MKCALAGGLVTELAHSGVYLGEGIVAELDGDGVLKAVSVSEFLNGACGEWKVAALRTGFRVYAACDGGSGRPLASPEVAAAARAAMENAGRPSGRYHLFLNNCHRFTAQCVEGRTEIADWNDGVWMLGRLEEVVRRALNGGKPMCWRAIRPSAAGFRYAATKGKRVQHHLLEEGALALVACAVGLAVGKAVAKSAPKGRGGVTL